MRLSIQGCFAVAMMSLTWACEEPSTKPNGPLEASPLVPAGADPVVSDPSEPSVPSWQLGTDASPAAALEKPAGAGGEGGAPPEPIVAPYGVSAVCSDAIVGGTEECDDGGEGSDACTAGCQTRDQGVLPTADSAAADRYQGAGRHPVAGQEAGFISTYVSVGDAEPRVGATMFDIWGKRSHVVDVSAGAFPIDEANPVAAALPGGRYAVAWSDFDGDGSDLGVAMREVKADGSVGTLSTANGSREFSQLNPDMIWTGNQLVVAWEDYSDPLNGPDLRVRTFDGGLKATSSELTLAATAAPEAGVALAKAGSGWAAAYREGTTDGKENVVVRVGTKVFRVGPVVGGPLDDRPALVELDATHLLTAFSVQTDPSANGSYDISRVRYAVIDTEGAAVQSSFALDPLDDVYSLDLQVSQSSPVLAAGNDGIYLGWRSEGRPGDPAGDQLWLKYVTWNAMATPALRLWDQEMLMPRTCEGSVADQRRPALARVGLPPFGALAMGWDDYSRSQGLGAPDVVVHYAPTYPRDAGRVQAFTEKFSGAAASSWGQPWSMDAAPTLTTDILRNEGRVIASAAGSTVQYVNRHTALDVDLKAKLRMGNNGELVGLIARRADATRTYLGFSFGTASNELFRLYTMINGTRADVATQAPPYLFTLWAQQVDFWVRFRVQTDPATGVISLAGKFWQASLPEPSTWLLSGSVPAGVQSTFATRAGHFGLYTAHAQSNRTIYIDEFQAQFVEGAIFGSSATGTELSLPLRRQAASYRVCQPGATCARGEGCCLSDLECEAGLACSRGAGELEHLGSHAAACTPSHCTDKKLTPSSDEVRVDCGGVDCPACACTSTVARGVSGYCTDICPCGIGDADCTTSSTCLPGLICAQEKGFKYGWAQGTDVCVPAHCVDRVLSGDETGVDTGGSCGNIACSGSANGGYQHCSPSCKCAKGHGNVNYKDECEGDLVVGVGARWGYTFDVCVAPHCANAKQDADETGKDCGGADCGPICP